MKILNQSTPVFIQVADEIRRDILGGKYPPGMQIPTVRQIAYDVSVNPNTVQKSLALLEDIFVTYGADSFMARAGCVIAGANEAIFYITAVYFSKTKVTKFRYAILVGILANFIGAIAGCWLCRIV